MSTTLPPFAPDVPRLLLGLREWAALPDFGLACVVALVRPERTGSCLRGEVLEDSAEGEVRFLLRPIVDDPTVTLYAVAKLRKGALRESPVISTRWVVGAISHRIDLELLSIEDGLPLLEIGAADLFGFRTTVSGEFLAGLPALYPESAALVD